MLGNILLTIAIVAVLLFFLLPRKKVAGDHGHAHPEATTTTEVHAPVVHAAKSGGHDDHGHGGPSAISLSFAALILVVAGCLAIFFYRYAGLGSIPQTRGQALREQVSSAPSASSYSTPVIPPTACSVTPSDARKVIAPVDGCSETITVKDSGWYLCTDPGLTSGRVRSKSWFGSTEPTSWSDASTKGNRVCLGATPGTDPTVATEEVVVHVWEEKKVLP